MSILTDPKDHEMKNVNLIPKLEQNCESEPQFKDVVIIGNGPSGIALSYILDGNIPFYNQKPHPDEMLQARLQDISPTKSLLDQDLKYLSSGLEGRSRNPISLLIDTIEHPNADLGIQHPSLLKWEKDPSRKIDHVCLGKGTYAGGSWHQMDPHILTLSLGSWMALPGLMYPENGRTSAGTVAKYYKDYVRHKGLDKYFHMGTMVMGVKVVNLKRRRKKYENEGRQEQGIHRYKKMCKLICCKCWKRGDCFVEKMYFEDGLLGNDFDGDGTRHGVLNNMLNGHTCPNPKTNAPKSPTTTVCNILDRSQSFSCDNNKRRHCYLSCTQFCTKTIEEEQQQQQILKNNNNCEIDNDNNDDDDNNLYKWEINGYDYKLNKHFKYYSKELVLATGASDQPNKLGIQNEHDYPDFVLHNLCHLEDAFQHLKGSDPVLIVGAGLSAADAVIVARSRSLPVLHVFRKKNASLDKQLPENMYPEYHKVHKMMSDHTTQYPLYTALPEHKLVKFDPVARTCTLENTKTATQHTTKVSYIAILIGSRPNLNFLPQTFKIGTNPKLPIDCKTNPILIDPFNHKIQNCDHLYALGPLAGDNFVRFIPGGALAIAADLFKR